MGYNWLLKMKKILFFFAIVIASVALTSFAINKQSSNEKGTRTGNDYIYYTSVIAWSTATDSETYHIYYKEGNGVRKYYSSCGDTRSMTCLLSVKENELYGSNACKDFRRNYKYRTGGYHAWYFNCSKGLPNMVDEDRIRR